MNVNDVVTTYVHIACLTWRKLLHNEMAVEVGIATLLKCKAGLAKYGYSFALVKQAGVVARKENNNA